MKQYIVDRHTDPSNPTLVPVPSERIPVYDTKAEMESDLANLGENEFVMTKDTGEELSKPVNVVEEGNLNAVTSNAVFEAVKEEVLWENPNPTSSFSATNLTNQTLGVDLSEYSVIYVYVKNASVGGYYSVCKCYKNLPSTLTAPAGKYIHTRNCNLTDSQIEIDTGYATSTADGTATVNDGVAIPIKIWGVKGV
ncbi:MAG: hypothetical protein J6S67_14400 [Methanobrevibacter sp.]|nr:hypothetical protein [Methanobrevibacter sp.]